MLTLCTSSRSVKDHRLFFSATYGHVCAKSRFYWPTFASLRGLFIVTIRIFEILNNNLFPSSFHRFSLLFIKILFEVISKLRGEERFRIENRVLESFGRSLREEDESLSRSWRVILGDVRARQRFPRNEVNFYRETQILPLSYPCSNRIVPLDQTLFFSSSSPRKKEGEEEEETNRRFLSDGIRKNRTLEFLNACSIRKIFIDRTPCEK